MGSNSSKGYVLFCPHAEQWKRVADIILYTSSQLLNRNPKHRLGAQRDTAELKEHPFFKSIDWDALGKKQVTPPFKPIVDSDESTNNFDPEFTSADLRETGIDIFDDEDVMSVSDESTLVNGQDASDRSTTTTMGSEMVNGHVREGTITQATAMADGVMSNGTGHAGTNSNKSSHGTNAGGGFTNGHSKETQATAVKQNNKKSNNQSAAHTPLSSSVQEKFRGFTFQGESTLDEAMMDGGEYYDDDEEYDDDGVAGRGDGYGEDEDEWEDEEPGGRYKRPAGQKSTFTLDV